MHIWRRFVCSVGSASELSQKFIKGVLLVGLGKKERASAAAAEQLLPFLSSA